MKKYYQIIILFLIIIIAFIVGHYTDDFNKNSERDSISSTSCLSHKLTLIELREMASRKGISVTQKDVDEMNQQPLCRDFCNEQLQYSQKYDDWFAEDDMRKTCDDLGVPLPIK